MKVVETVQDWYKIRKSIQINRPLGFVPTMGALHDGHLALIDRCIKENSHSVVSIFINPTQFNDKTDHNNYPQNIQDDVSKLKELGVKYLFSPSYNDLYPDNYTYKIIESEYSKILCGANRPGHFDGVLTVVMKLLNIIKPNKVYFGEKDFQQLQLVKNMVNTFFLDIQVIACDTIRDQSGLALSSRNELLNEEELNTARFFPYYLQMKLDKEKITEKLEKKGFTVEYIEEIDGRRFGAVKLREVRLIDNVKI